MGLDRVLSENRSVIINKWREAVIQSYPKETRRFLKKEKSRFSNPVGFIVTKDIEILFDEMVKGKDTEKIYNSLDKIIRVRAVQDFKPSHAVAFVLQLKAIVREVLGKGNLTELSHFEDRIDATALLAFDIYSQCRQQIYDIRVNEVRNEFGRLLQRANLIKEIPDKQPGI